MVHKWQEISKTIIDDLSILSFNGQNQKIIKNIGQLFCGFLANYVPKSEKILLIIQKASISNYRCHAIKYFCPKKLVLKSFLDTILQSISLWEGREKVLPCWLFSLVLLNWYYEKWVGRHASFPPRRSVKST